jgi:hypothetical protein
MDSHPSGPERQPYLSYRPGRLQRLAELIPGLLKRLQIRALYLFTQGNRGGEVNWREGRGALVYKEGSEILT